MKGYLVWKDGRREETSFVGAQRIYMPVLDEDGRVGEVVFEADPEVVDGCITYREVQK